MVLQVEFRIEGYSAKFGKYAAIIVSKTVKNYLACPIGFENLNITFKLKKCFFFGFNLKTPAKY